MIDGRYYRDIVEVKVADAPEAANDLLDRGFELLKVESLSFIVGAASESHLIFVLGRAGTVAKPAAPQGPAAAQSSTGTTGPAPTQRPSGPANSSRPSNPFAKIAKPMIAKYEGTCRICNGHIEEGDPILYEQGIGAAHQWCVPAR